MAFINAKTNKISTILEDLSKGNNADLLVALESLVQAYKEKSSENVLTIDISPFSNSKLGILEVLVKYCKENLGLTYHRVAELLKRDDRTIWVTYSKAKKKRMEKFYSKENSLNIPLTVFSDRNLGPLEALVVYLKESKNLDYKEISQLLARDYRTIWLSYRNAIKKRGSYGK